MKKTLIVILFLILFCFVLFWVGSFTYCEILTVRHGQEFTELYKLTNMIDKVDYLKVLNYSDNIAKVYYVAEHAGGDVIIFTKQSNEWELEKWYTVWSKYGSADDFMWPYIR
ncbi:hypothetical protein IZU99_04010 [Oscillospiraceae bacterium CM]|nr:hypothetical protein IZU99_04010 [Oscillospiraceae bacterium CM]